MLLHPSLLLSAFVGFQFPPEVILLSVRCYLRFGLSHRDLEELLANAASRSITFDAPRVVWRPRNIHHVRTPRRCTRTARWISPGSVAALNRPRPGEYARRTFGEERRSDPSGRERRS